MADRNPLLEAGQGLFSGVASNNPITILTNAGIDLADLATGALATGLHKAGLLKTEEMPNMTDKSQVPMSSEYIRHQIETNPDSGYGLGGNLVGGLLSPGNLVGGLRKIIAGAGAKKAPPGGSPEWFRGNTGDKAPRFEINDQYAQMKGPLRPGTETVLGQVLDHPELYDQYPQLKGLSVKAMSSSDAAKTTDSGRFANWGAHGADPETGKATIFINPNLSPADQRSTLLHEIQHNVQHREKFVGGASPEGMRQNAEALSEWAQNALKTNDVAAMAKIDDLRTKLGVPVSVLIDPKKLADHLYTRTGGEVEARAVQTRANMSAHERKQSPVQESQDMPPLAWEDVKKTVFGPNGL